MDKCLKPPVATQARECKPDQIKLFDSAWQPLTSWVKKFKKPEINKLKCLGNWAVGMILWSLLVPDLPMEVGTSEKRTLPLGCQHMIVEIHTVPMLCVYMCFMLEHASVSWHPFHCPACKGESWGGSVSSQSTCTFLTSTHLIWDTDAWDLVLKKRRKNGENQTLFVLRPFVCLWFVWITFKKRQIYI